MRVRLRILGDTFQQEVAALRETVRAADTAESRHDTAWYEALSVVNQVKQLADLMSHRETEQTLVAALERQIHGRTDRLGSFRDQQSEVFRCVFEGNHHQLHPARPTQHSPPATASNSPSISP